MRVDVAQKLYFKKPWSVSWINGRLILQQLKPSKIASFCKYFDKYAKQLHWSISIDYDIFNNFCSLMYGENWPRYGCSRLRLSYPLTKHNSRFIFLANNMKIAYYKYNLQSIDSFLKLIFSTIFFFLND